MKTRTKRRLTALAAVLVVGAAAAVGARAFRGVQRERVLERRLEAGTLAYDEGRYEEAIPDLAFAYGRSDRRDAELVYRLADARRRVPMGDGRHVSEAATYAREAVRLDPTHEPAQRLLLRLLTRMGARTEALAAADRLLELRPDDREAMLAQVALQRAASEREAALEAARRLAAAHPNDREARALVVGLMIETRHDPDSIAEAAAAAAEALDDPLEGAILEASALLELGRPGEALDRIERAGVSGIDDADRLSRTVRLLDAAAGAPELAERAEALVAEALAGHEAGIEAETYRLARAWRRPNPSQIGAAAERLRGAPDAGPATRAWLRIAAGDAPDGAGGEQDEASGPWALLADAHDQLARGDHRAAVETTQRAAQLLGTTDLGEPNTREARDLAIYLRSEALANLSALSEAERGYARLAESPEWGRARLRLAQVQLAQGRPRDARRTLLTDPRLVNTLPGARAIVEAGVSIAEDPLASRGEREEAIALAARLLDTSVPPHESLPLALRARAANGDPAGALEFARRIAELREIDAAETLRAAELVHRSAPEAAAALRNALASRAGDDPDVLLQRAVALADAGRADEGVAMLRDRAASAAGEHAVELHRRLARLLDRIGRTAEAVEAMRRLAAFEDSAAAQEEILRSQAAWTDDALLRTAIANLRAMTGENAPGWRKAEARRILLHDGEPDAPGRSLALLTRVIDQNPSDAEALLLAADAWLELGDRGMAIESLGRAVDRGAKLPELYVRLIALLHEAGRNDAIAVRLDEYMALRDLTAEQARDRAALLERFGRREQALAERRRLAEATGEEIDRAALARLLAIAGDSEQAATIYRDLASNPDASLQTLQSAATFLAASGDLDAALALAERAAALPGGAALVGDVLRTAGEHARARSEMLAVAEGAETPDAWRWLALRALEDGDAESAIADARAGLARHPDDPVLAAIRRTLDASGRRLNEWDVLAAWAAGTGAQRGDPAFTLLAEALHAGGGDPTPSDLVRSLRGVTERHPTLYETWPLLIQANVAAGQPDAAVRTAVDAARLLPGDPRTARDAARLYAALDRIDEALAYARTWRERSGAASLEPDLLTARLHLTRGDAADAAAALAPHREAILASAAERPGDVRTLLAADLASGGVDGAAEALRAAALPAETRTALAVSLAGEIADPARRAAWIEAFAPPSELAVAERLTLARGWLDLASRTRDADLYARAVEAVAPDRLAPEDLPLAAPVLAAAKAGAGDASGAEAVWRDALARGPEDPALLVGLARHLTASGGDTAEAQRLATRAAEAAEGPARIVALAAAAEAAIAGERFDEAIILARRGLQAEPGSPRLTATLAEAALRAGDRDAAAAALDALPSVGPRSAAALTVARALEDDGLSDGAEWLYRRVLEQAPESATAANNLAFLQVRSGRATEETVRLARTALRAAVAAGVAPAAESSILDTLGHAQLAAGDAASASDTFRRAVGLAPDKLSSRIGLAIALWQDGQRDEAREALAHAEALAGGAPPPDPFLSRVLTAARSEIR